MASSNELVIGKVELCPIIITWKSLVLVCCVCFSVAQLSNLAYRDPRHRIIPSASLSGSVNAAFDDVTVQDLDFESIQGRN